MLVECTAPVEFHGQLISSVTRRNGLIVDTDVSELYARVVAEVNRRCWVDMLFFIVIKSSLC